MRGIGAYAQQVARFALLLSERGGLAVSILLNSVLIARLLTPGQAAAYFVTASVLQIGMSPWVPAGEVAWLGKPHKLDEREVTNDALVTSLAFTITLGLPSVLFTVSQIDPEYYSIVFVGAASYLSNVFVLWLLPSKFGDVRQFRTYAIVYILISVLTKILMIALAPPMWVLNFALFAELFAGGLAAIWLCRDNFGSLRVVPSRIMHQATSLMSPAFSVMMALMASRSGLLVVSLVEAPRHVQTFGLAFQIMNAASLVSSAIAGTAANGLRANSARPLLLPAALIASCLVFGLIAFLLVGRPLISFLLGTQSEAVYDIVLAGFPFCAALLMHGLTSAVAAVYKVSRIYAVCSLCMAFVTGLVMLAPVDGILERTFWWASTYAALAIATCVFISIIGRKRLVLLEGSQDESAQ